MVVGKDLDFYYFFVVVVVFFEHCFVAMQAAWFSERQWSVNAPLWTRLKYVTIYGMDSSEIWYRYRWSPEDES